MSWLMIRPTVLVATLVAFGSSANAQTAFERGKYLVNTIMACGNCHTPKDSNGTPILERELSGGLTFTIPPFNGAAANITPDRETGIGDWSDDDIKRAITHGTRPANARLPGVPLAAVMAAGFFKALLPEDQTAIVAYLRSVKPVRNSLPNPVYRVPVQHDHYPEADTGYTQDMMRDPVKRGSYLVTIGHCMECHSPRVKGVSDYKTGLGKGGRIFSSKDVRGFPVNWPGATAPNITSHPEKGLGRWSDAEIKRAITQGISRNGRQLQPPMDFASYRGMTNDDLNAIVAYLRTVPPLE